jgi:hypothetical protein
VTRENVDVIQFNQANAPEGTNVLDAGGSGPGGIAQTITGLTRFHFCMPGTLVGMTAI